MVKVFMLRRLFYCLLCCTSISLLCVNAYAQGTNESSTAGAESFAEFQRLSARQSLLFRVAGNTLAVVKRVTNNQSADARSADTGHVNVMPVASVNAEATFNTLRGRSSISADHPYVVWIDSDGDVIEVTTFDDPRLLRSPQQGQRAHSATFAQADGLFLLRGPANATSLHLHLPDRSLLISQIPETARSGSTGQRNSSDSITGSIADSASGTPVDPAGANTRTDLKQRSWLVNLDNR